VSRPPLYEVRHVPAVPAHTVRVPIKANHAVFSTGWYGAPGLRRGGIVHVKVKGERRPVCGVRMGDDMRFQWCAHGVREEWVECRSCKRILGLKPVVAGAAA
jgi:hypothetical protein